MTNTEIDDELKRLDKSYGDALQSLLLADFSCDPTENIPRGILLKNLTKEYHTEKMCIDVAGDNSNDI
jgi:hypothetical protein